MSFIINALIGLWGVIVSFRNSHFKRRMIIHLIGALLIIILGFINWKENNDLSRRLEPFEEFASLKYPNKSLDEALNLLQKNLQQNTNKISSLETKIKPRTIPPEKMQQLIVKLKSISDNLIIQCESGDSESLNLMNQIVKIFKRDDRKFRIEQVTRDKPVFGLYVVGKNNKLDEESNLILKNFSFLNMQEAKLSKSNPDNTIIIVGTKEDSLNKTDSLIDNRNTNKYQY